ncbi:MAG: O-antigen ligase family protein, partial [Bacteroidales bacterium]|nr:O-antigen ligase family protein [Bacteroidales bacterium]
MNNIFVKIKTCFAANKYLQFVLLACFAFMLACSFFIYKEILWFPYLVFGIIGVYVLVFRLEWFFYLTAFLIPFSVELREIMPAIRFGFSIPGELMLAAMTILFLLRIILDNAYPLIITKHRVSLVILFYLFWIFLTSITSTLPDVSFKFFAAKIWFIVPAYFLFAQFLKKNIRSAVTFFLCYAVGLAMVVCITTYKHLGMADFQHAAYWVMSPYYNDHTAYGCILAFFMPVLAVISCMKTLPKWQRLLSLALLFPVFIGLYLSFSRAAWLSVVVALGLCGILFLKIKIKTAIFVLGTVFLLGFAFQNEIMYRLSKNTQDSSAGNFSEHIRSITNITSDDSNIERLNRWSAVMKMTKERPVLGWGPGTYQFNYASYQNPAYRTTITTNAGTGGNAHSEYFGPLSESGVVGMLSVLIMVFTVIATGINTYRKAKRQDLRLLSLMCVLALTSYYFHGMLNNFLDTDKLAVPVFGSMAVIVACNILMKREENFSFSGTVIHGSKIGRTIGFPTLNIAVLQGEIPTDGVSIVKVFIEDKHYFGIMSIGNRPTFADGDAKTIEIHLLDISGDFYGLHLKVVPIYFIRENKKFDSVDALKQQLQADKDFA